MTDRLDLPATGTCDLVTRGRRSGEARTVEIWYVVLDGVVHVTGTPGTRGWLANLRSDPRCHVRFREPQVQAGARARVVEDPQERRRVAEGAWRVQPWYAEQPYSLDEWVAAAPMVALDLATFTPA